MPYNCGICDGAEPASFLLTPLNGADTTAFGQNCAPLALSSVLAAFLGLDPEKLYDQLLELSGNAPDEPPPAPAPDGMVYKSGTGDLYATDDIDGGLCGFVHDDWRHCHRQAGHAGKHGKATPRQTETAQGPPAVPASGPAPGGEAQ